VFGLFKSSPLKKWQKEHNASVTKAFQAPRWLEACEQQMAPRVFLTRTHKRALEVIPLKLLRQYAADLN
jgi:uncharacterized protein (DUF2237 family)